MKFAIAALCLFGAALALPQNPQDAKVIRSDIQPPSGANFIYDLATDSQTATMKFAIAALCLFGAALALPQNPQDAKVIRSDIQPPSGANFIYDVEIDDGTKFLKEGTTGSEGQSNMKGSFSFFLPDGTLAEFSYYADETGYHVESPLLPVGPPLPAHAIEQIRVAKEQRPQEITFK